MTRYVAAPVPPKKEETWAELRLNTHRPYYISSAGRLFSTFSGRLLDLKVTSGVKVFDYTPSMDKCEIKPLREGVRKGKRVNITLQRLVAATFLKRPPGCDVVIHLNHDKLDNSVSNLKWTTTDDAMRNIHLSPGWKNGGTSKLTATQVKGIKKALQEGENRLSIAQEYGVTDMQIYRIQNGDCWNHVEGYRKPKQPVKKFNARELAKIREQLKSGLKQAAIATSFGVSPTTICRIAKGIYYRA